MSNPILNIAGLAGALGPEAITTSQTAGARNAASGPAAAESTARPQADSTSVSSLGGALGAAAAKASASSNIRTDLVASLRAQITSGMYHPDPSAVAAKVAGALRASR
jgi:flagellar biosynthesis anti-sigma factor FlgM